VRGILRPGRHRVQVQGRNAPACGGISLVAVRGGLRGFPSIGAWAHPDVKGWTLADMIDDAQYAPLQREAQTALKHKEAAAG
jgi:hypothetical protein